VRATLHRYSVWNRALHDGGGGRGNLCCRLARVAPLLTMSAWVLFHHSAMNIWQRVTEANVRHRHAKGKNLGQNVAEKRCGMKLTARCSGDMWGSRSSGK
jgi:hypothetical protein